MDSDRVLDQAIRKAHALLQVNCMAWDRLPDGEMIRQMRELLGSEHVQAAIAASDGLVAAAMGAVASAAVDDGRSLRDIRVAFWEVLDAPGLDAALSELRNELYGRRGVSS
jgi:hypothetical protein